MDYQPNATQPARPTGGALSDLEKEAARRTKEARQKFHDELLADPAALHDLLCERGPDLPLADQINFGECIQKAIKGDVAHLCLLVDTLARTMAAEEVRRIDADDVYEDQLREDADAKHDTWLSDNGY